MLLIFHKCLGGFDLSDISFKQQLLEPVTWYTNPYATAFEELNGIYFPPIPFLLGMPGVSVMNPDGSTGFLPDIDNYRSFIIELIRRGLVRPSEALISRLAIQSDEITSVGGYLQNLTVVQEIFPNLGAELCAQQDNGFEEYAKDCEALALVRKIPADSFKTMPDAITLEKQFAVMYNVRLYGEEIYVFCRNHYVAVSDTTLLQMMRGTFADVIESPPNVNSGARRSSNICNDVLKELRMDGSLVLREDRISRTMIAFRNGYFDMESGGFVFAQSGYIPEKAVFYSVNSSFLPGITIPYNWQTATPNFDRYLQDVTGGDATLIYRIWEIIGYVLSQDTYRKCCFVFQGIPGSGKSTLERLIKRMFSVASVFNLVGTAFSERFALARLNKKAVIVSSDLPDRPFSEKEESMIKQISGLDEIDTDVKFRDRRSFYSRAKLLFFTNNPIVTRSAHPEAFFERLVCIPFRYKVTPRMTDTEFDALLASELDGIVTKAFITYLRRYGQPGFVGSYEVNEIFGRDLWSRDPMAKLVYNYAEDCFAGDECGKVFVETAYRDFLKRYGLGAENLYVNKFSEWFQLAVKEIFGAVHNRAAPAPGQNFQSCVRGISMK